MRGPPARSRSSKGFSMPDVLASRLVRSRAPILLVALMALVTGASAMAVGCDSEQTENNLAQTAASASPDASDRPQVLSLAPLDSPTADMHDLVLSWEPIPDIDRFAICETTPPQGTDCEDHVGVSEASVTVPGPAADPLATGTWLKYLWLQSCDERECSRPPTPAGAIAHRAAFGTNAWNLIVVVRRLEGDQIELFMANASRKETTVPSTLIARTPAGLELGRCEDVAPGDWCGPLTSALLSNDFVAEQVYDGVGLTVEFPVMPSSTGPQ